MDYQPRLAIGGWGESLALDRARLQIFLDALVQANVAILRAYPKLPRLYQSGVRYRSPEDQCGGCDEDDPWADALASLAAGYVDCEDAACWLAAERIVRDGIEAHVTARITYDAGSQRQRIHVTVKSAAGDEDPALVLGMPG